MPTSTAPSEVTLSPSSVGAPPNGEMRGLGLWLLDSGAHTLAA